MFGPNLGTAIEIAAAATVETVEQVEPVKTEQPLLLSASAEENAVTLHQQSTTEIIRYGADHKAEEASSEAWSTGIEDREFVGLWLPPQEAGKITFSADRYRSGVVFFGPKGSKELLGRAAFLQALQAEYLKFYPFTKDKRGAVVTELKGHFECPACGTRVPYRQKEHRGGRAPKCTKCFGQPMAYKADTPELPGEDSPVAEKLWEAYSGKKISDYTAPRVWAVYPVAAAPSEFIPPRDDHRAVLIDQRCLRLGYTIRPYGLSVASGVPWTSLVAEATTDASGRPTLFCGWADRNSLIRDAEDDGYRTQLRRLHRPSSRIRFCGV
jgi:predicted RNA-binding Zn-ribbon protein involved in translation (DUF1610 family)